MVKKCLLCGTAEGKDWGVTFHRIPIDPPTRKYWLEIIEKENVPIAKNTYLCSEHFLSKDIELKQSGRVILKPGTVPLPQVNVSENIKVEQVKHEEEEEDPLAFSSEEQLQVDPLPSTSYAIEDSDDNTSSTLTATETGYNSNHSEDSHSENIVPVKYVTKKRTKTSTSLQRTMHRRVIKSQRMCFFGDCKLEDMSNEFKARKMFLIASATINRQRKVIQNLQRSKVRLKNKICSLNSLVKYLRSIITSYQKMQNNSNIT